MASSMYNICLSGAEIVELLEADDPVSDIDISDESAESEPDYTGNHSDWDSDGENDEENSSGVQKKSQTMDNWLSVDMLYVLNRFPFFLTIWTKKECYYASKIIFVIL